MHDDGIFDERVAAGYDAPGGDEFDPAVIEATVDYLAELAGDGPALELAIGTGRIGLPLAQRGIEVHGIDISRPMVAELRAKPGGDAIPVAIGDMTSTRVDGAFSLVYLVFNTISNLTTQAGQVACFRNAATHLAPGGVFLIEVWIPELRRLPPGDRYVVFDFGASHWGSTSTTSPTRA
jgi:SAM-dependent methyltransferase